MNSYMSNAQNDKIKYEIVFDTQPNCSSPVDFFIVSTEQSFAKHCFSSVMLRYCDATSLSCECTVAKQLDLSQ